MSLLAVKSVTKTFRAGAGVLHAVNGVSISIGPGESLGLIGESGCGKSTLGRLVLGIYQPDSGSVEFQGEDIGHMPHAQLRRVRRHISIVFQEPYAALDPMWTVERLVGEPLLIHEPRLGRAERRARVAEALEMVTLDASFFDRYPRSLSGGQAQRVGIARAIVTRPELVVLDEPTSSLDLSIRTQILQLLRKLQREIGLAYLLISHDLHSIRSVTERAAVMYLGQVVEEGSTQALLSDPKHPYTQMLLDSELSLTPRARRIKPRGEIPSPLNLPTGCFFYSRCPMSIPQCAAAPVPLFKVGDDRAAACIRLGDEIPLRDLREDALEVASER